MSKRNWSLLVQSVQKCFYVPANCIERDRRSRALDLILRKGLCLVILKLEDEKELAA